MTLEEICEIESKLQYVFSDKGLLLRAFTHSSYAKEKGCCDNERLEFFGDAILDMVVSEYLCEKRADYDVGALSTMRSNIVSAKGLRPIVDDLDLIKYLKVGFGASVIKSASKKIESNLYEAVVCAIYLDGGLQPAKDFILRTLKRLIDEPEVVERKDSKTLLQEYCQKHKISAPKYVLINRSGADNNPTYKCALYVDGELSCYGEGPNKKAAEQVAAKKLVTKWRIDSALS